MKKGYFFIVFVVFLMLSACEDTDKPIPVLVQETGTSYIEAFGTVTVEKVIGLSLDFPARLEYIHVKEGQKVEQGEVLATLDLTPFEEERNRILKEMERVRTELARLQKKIQEKETVLQDERIPEMQKSTFLIQVLEERKERVYEEYNRQKDLVKAGSFAAHTLHGLEREMKDINTEIEILSYTIQSLKYSLHEEVERLKEQLSNYRINIAVLQNQLDKCNNRINQPYLEGNQIICPIDTGIIDEILYIQGSMLSPYQTLFRFQDLDYLTIIAEVDEQFIDRVRAGSLAYIIPDANREYEFKGTVTHISSRAIKRSGETIIPVNITLNTENRFLKPGYNVQIYIDPE